MNKYNHLFTCTVQLIEREHVLVQPIQVRTSEQVQPLVHLYCTNFAKWYFAHASPEYASAIWDLFKQALGLDLDTNFSHLFKQAPSGPLTQAEGCQRSAGLFKQIFFEQVQLLV